MNQAGREGVHDDFGRKQRLSITLGAERYPDAVGTGAGRFVDLQPGAANESSARQW